MTRGHRAPPTITRSNHRTSRIAILVAFGALIVLALPGASAIYIEGEAPAHSGAYLQADVAPPEDPLSHPLILTAEELQQRCARAADATRSPGMLLNMTTDEEADFQHLQTLLAEGGHDGVQVNGTGYRFAIAMAEVFATGHPDGEGSMGPPGHEPTGNDTAHTETGEASGIAIGGLTLLSVGAMYWMRRLA